MEYEPEPLHAVEIPVISDTTRARAIEYATHALSWHTDVIEEAIAWHIHREARELFIKTFPVTVDVTGFRVLDDEGLLGDGGPSDGTNTSALPPTCTRP